MTKYLSILIVLFLFACGSSTTTPTAKDLFSSWTSTSNGIVMDFTGGSFDTALSFTFLFKSGAKCTCNLTASGSQSVGTYKFTSCTFVTSSATSDPGCSSLNDNGTYTNTSNTLKACSSVVTSSCSTYN